MSTLWIAAIVLAAPPMADHPASRNTGSAVTSPSTGVVEKPLARRRTGRELRDAVRAALRRWARADEKQADAAAGEFLVLYGELKRDDAIARSQREQLRLRVRRRLLALSEQIRKRIAKDARPKSVDAAAGSDEVLAQFGGGAAQRGFGGFGAAGGGGQQPDDNGQELVELIQETVAPQTWDVNGGPGSIYYWRAGRALVVRQMGDVHDRLGGLLQQMGRLGR